MKITLNPLARDRILYGVTAYLADPVERSQAWQYLRALPDTDKGEKMAADVRQRIMQAVRRERRKVGAS